MSEDQTFVFDGINPQPWTASESSVGRKGGGTFVMHHKPQQLVVYQASLQEAWDESYGDLALPVYPEGTRLVVQMFFWRQRETKDTQGRKSVSGTADATNLQKSTEDALQGLIYKNDQANVVVMSAIAEQERDTTPLILVKVRSFGRRDQVRLSRLMDDAHAILEARAAAKPKRRPRRDLATDDEDAF